MNSCGHERNISQKDSARQRTGRYELIELHVLTTGPGSLALSKSPIFRWPPRRASCGGTRGRSPDLPTALEPEEAELMNARSAIDPVLEPADSN